MSSNNSLENNNNNNNNNNSINNILNNNDIINNNNNINNILNNNDIINNNNNNNNNNNINNNETNISTTFNNQNFNENNPLTNINNLPSNINSNQTHFDDIPLPCSNNNYDFEKKLLEMESQYQNESQKNQEQINEFNLPLPLKLSSKNWKCRKSALDTLNLEIKNSSEFNSNLYNLLPKIIIENHTGNLEFALEIYINFFSKQFYIKNEDKNILLEIFKNLFDKGYCNIKSNIKEKSKNIILNIIENLNETDSLCEILNNFIESKNQKYVQNSIILCKEILMNFGAAQFNYKMITLNIIKLSDKVNAIIKNEIVDYIIELYKWIKKGIKFYIEGKGLKEMIKADIEKGIENIDEKIKNGTFNANSIKPIRFLNKNSKKKLENCLIINDNNDIEMKNIDFDNNNNNNFNEEEEIDIFTKKTSFDEKFIENLLKPEKKWKEKKEMLDNFSNFLQKKKKIKHNPSQIRHSFIEMLKLLLNDKNINVLYSTINVIYNLTIKLKNNFSEAKEFFYKLLEHFKEKKENFNQMLNTCLNSMIEYLDDNFLIDNIIKFSNGNLPSQSKEKLCVLIEEIIKKKIIIIILKF